MPPSPQISLQLRTFSDDPDHDWGSTLALGRAMDLAGVDRVVVSDHVVFGENSDAYANPALGGIAGGRQPTGPDGQWLEPLTVLTALAAQTTRIRLGTAVLLAALRRPAVLAKQVATLDVLSGGRVDLGVGVGWQREEYDAAGVPWERRWSRHDDTIRACRALWAGRGEPVSFDSPTVSFEGIWCEPAPAQERLPIWFGAKATPKLAARLAEQGDGWLPLGRMRPDDVVAESAVLREAFVDAGRNFHV